VKKKASPKSKQTRKTKIVSRTNAIMQLYPESDVTNLSYYETFKNMNSWREEIDEPFINKLSVDLIGWSHQKESLRLTQFFGLFGLQEPIFYRWCKKFPQLQRAKQYALDRLADRREIGVAYGALNASAILPTMTMYCNTWAAARQYEALLKIQDTKMSYEDLSAFVMKLREQEYNRLEDDDGAITQDAEVSTAALSDNDHT
jgi:hypothetical protein